MSKLHILFLFFTCIIPKWVAEVRLNLGRWTSKAGVREVSGTTITSSSSKGKYGKHLQKRRKKPKCRN